MNNKNRTAKDKIKSNLKKIINKKTLQIGIFAIIQLIITILLNSFLIDYFAIYHLVMLLMVIFIYLYILTSDKNSAYKIIWFLLFSVFPIFGLMMFLSQYSDFHGKKLRKKMDFCQAIANLNIDKNYNSLKLLEIEDRDAFLISNYLTRAGFYPPESNTAVTYFKNGESKYEILKQKIKNAKHYIFLEYFIVEKGQLFDEILEILVQKISEGVDVRLIYDEFGVMSINGEHFNEELEALGIQVKVFNPVSKLLSISLNNRNHRKIAVIDGTTGFIGGINIADEYVNIDSPFGYWKDSAVMLEGNGVLSLVTMFLSLWSAIDRKHIDFSEFKKYDATSEYKSELGIVQPYFDNSFDEEPLSENLYIEIISRAKHDIKITTPYLVPTDELIRTLRIAAKSGINVSIVTPYIQDKKYIRLVNQSYYSLLIKSGIKIYEYLPGFVHAKMMVADGKFATVGSVNFDYRSFYLNMEAGCFMYNVPAIKDINEDIDNMIAESHQITVDDLGKQSIFKRFLQAALRTFAPLM